MDKRATARPPPRVRSSSAIPPALATVVLLLMAGLLSVVPGPAIVRAVSSSQAYRGTAHVEDAELADAATLTNGTLENSTLIQCAGWCSRRRPDCAAYSFRRSSVYGGGGGGGGGGNRGLCRLGTNAYDKRKRAGSRIYRLSADSDPTRDDGYVYFRVDAAFTFHMARAYCVFYDKGNLPVVYPSSVSFRKMNASFLLSTDKAFVDMRSIGDYKFITGLGDVVDARNKDNDANQHWAPGMPTAAAAASNSSGRFVLMGRAGWEDVAATATSTVIACQSDADSYRLIPETGRYYAVKKPATVPDARRNCLADGGGTLASTYGTADGRFPVFDEYRQVAALYTAYLVVGGTTNVVPLQILEFEDGTQLNYTNQASVDQDPRQKWHILYRNVLFNCLYMTSIGWIDYYCHELKYYLCERDAP